MLTDFHQILRIKNAESFHLVKEQALLFLVFFLLWKLFLTITGFKWWSVRLYHVWYTTTLEFPNLKFSFSHVLLHTLPIPLDCFSLLSHCRSKCSRIPLFSYIMESHYSAESGLSQSTVIFWCDVAKTIIFQISTELEHW